MNRILCVRLCTFACWLGFSMGRSQADYNYSHHRNPFVCNCWPIHWSFSFCVVGIHLVLIHRITANNSNAAMVILWGDININYRWTIASMPAMESMSHDTKSWLFLLFFQFLVTTSHVQYTSNDSVIIFGFLSVSFIHTYAYSSRSLSLSLLPFLL